jgi:hypothetical protein
VTNDKPGKLPKKAGMYDRVLLESRIRIVDQHLTNATAIRDLLEDYALFNHGALFCHGSATVDPVADFLSSTGRDVIVPFMQSDRPLILGLDPASASAIWLCPKDQWQDLDQFILSGSYLDRETQRLFLVSGCDTEIVDWRALARHATLPDRIPTVPVRLYTVNGSWGHFWVRPGSGLTVPQFMLGRPDPKVIALRDALLAKSANPLQDAEHASADLPTPRH